MKLKNIFLIPLITPLISSYSSAKDLGFKNKTQIPVQKSDQVLIENPEVLSGKSEPLTLKVKDDESSKADAVEVDKTEVKDEGNEPLKEERLEKRNKNNEENISLNMQEYRTNYAVFGDPDTKIQFSFKFKLVESLKLYLGYTQVLFWELEKVSKPFSDVNYNPDLFYDINLGDGYFSKLKVGYEHNSNGENNLESRSYDSAFLTLVGESKTKPGVPRLQLRLRTLHRLDMTNEDIEEYYGNFNLKFYFKNLGKRIFRSEEFYLEYYTSNDFRQMAERSSVRLSLRFKLFKTKASPKLFIQYFNGFGENLANYDKKTETFRVGFSIGGE